MLGTDGIGADMLEEFRLAYVAHRADDVLAVARHGVVVADQRLPLRPRVRRRPRHVDATTTSTRRGTSRSRPASGPLDVVTGDGEVLVADGAPTRVDLAEVRAHAAEQAARLFARL